MTKFAFMRCRAPVRQPNISILKEHQSYYMLTGERLYYIKWQGYEEIYNTWEPSESFHYKEMIFIYEEMKNKLVISIENSFCN
jgi:hypothetical protein